MLQNPTFHITVFGEPPKLIFWFILLKRNTEALVTTLLLKEKVTPCILVKCQLFRITCSVYLQVTLKERQVPLSRF